MLFKNECVDKEVDFDRNYFHSKDLTCRRSRIEDKRVVSLAVVVQAVI